MSGLNMLSPSDCLEPPSHINHRNPEHFTSCFSMLNRLREEELVSLILFPVTLLLSVNEAICRFLKTNRDRSQLERY